MAAEDATITMFSEETSAHSAADNREGGRYAINSILRASAVLRVLAGQPKGLRIGDLAKKLLLDRTTVFRLISTLEECNFVERVPDSKAYRLGLGVFEIGSAYVQSTNLHAIAHPVMVDLAERVKEAVHWAILAGGRAVCIDKVDSPRRLSTTSKVGRSVPLNSASVGKVLLAFQPAETRERLLASMEFPKLTERTITAAEHMRTEIAQIRRVGYSMSLAEGDLDIACVAAPIFDHTGRITAGLSIGGAVQRFGDPETGSFLVAEVRKASALISEKLGCLEQPTFEEAA